MMLLGLKSCRWNLPYFKVRRCILECVLNWQALCTARRKFHAGICSRTRFVQTDKHFPVLEFINSYHRNQQLHIASVQKHWSRTQLTVFASDIYYMINGLIPLDFHRKWRKMNKGNQWRWVQG